ncbi:MAG: LCP family protein [Syntrophomonadaceae bacterium]|nr:LCP family protein [Syntrophomonadaceae bacterium]MDD4550322.1 LCP family protein [Syntrophomonadaceae bacterium]
MGWIKMYYGKILAGLLIFGLTFGTGTLVGNFFYGNNQSIEQKLEKSQPVNILFMGIDARAKEVNSRSDTMILASINKKTKQVALVWIPRDTRVKVKGHYAKINSVNYVMGPEEACKVVGDLFDTKVKYYAVTNFTGFAKIIDILGGVDIDVEMNMYHPDPNSSLNINLTKGLHHLNGQDALRYVRFRGGPTADIGRTGRQQTFIKALGKEMMQGENIFKLPQLIPEISDNIHTNIPLKDILYMAEVGRDFDTDNIVTQTLPGFPFTDPQTGASYWEVDQEISHGIIDKLFAGETFEVAKDPPRWAKPVYTKPESQEEETEQVEPTEETGTEQDGSETDTPENGKVTPGDQGTLDDTDEVPDLLPDGDSGKIENGNEIGNGNGEGESSTSNTGENSIQP